MASVSDSILRNLGGTTINDLNKVLSTSDGDDDDDGIPGINHSPYFDINLINSSTFSTKETFNILSINIQSVNAKFDQLISMLTFLQDHNLSFKAICLQESWLSDYHDVSVFQIPGYNLVHQGKRCCGHGGLMVYIQNQYSYTVRNMYDTSNYWEGLFLDITGPDITNKITLCNIYRPSTSNESNFVIESFISEITPIVEALDKENSNLIFLGDFNLNLLQINERERIQEYFDTFVSRGIFPKITFPTRFSKKRGTLIDQIFCRTRNRESHSSSGIILSALSDHLPCFSCLDILTSSKQKPKYIKKYNNSTEAINSFRAAIEKSISEINFDTDLFTDPNKNYEQLSNILTDAREKHLPAKMQKFNKRKHKLCPWITDGIITSLKYRDKLYKKLKSMPIDSL